MTLRSKTFSERPDRRGRLSRIVHWLSRLRARGLYRVSGFAGFDIQEVGDTQTLWDGTGFAYRLRAWPRLGPGYKTAAVYRALSVMSTRPVSVAWLSRRSGLSLDEAQKMVSWLVSQGYAHEIALDNKEE